MTWGSVWGGCLFLRPVVIVIFNFLFTLWHGAGSRGTVVAGCYDISIQYGGSGLCYTIISWEVGGEGSCGMAMLKMASIWFSAAVCFYPSCGMGLDGDGFLSVSVRSYAACVTASAGKRLGNFFWTGKSSVMLENRSGDILGMYGKAYIMYHIRTYIPSFLAVWCPGASVLLFVVH